MEDDWDLQAVVRGCATINTPSTATCHFISDGGFLSSFKPKEDGSFPCIQDLFEPRTDTIIEDLHDLYKPFFRKTSSNEILSVSPQNIPISPLSVLGGLQDVSASLSQQQQTQLHTKQSLITGASKSTSDILHASCPRPKRRKNNLKRVCHVPAEGLSSDMWSWRKYGQKPIKGSPYPRGYYRCSTSKGCPSRKQVERNRSEPGMFIVTYTSDHNHLMPTHRNSLAGSTRQKPVTPKSGNQDDPSKSSSSPAPGNQDDPNKSSSSPAPEKLESSREDIENMAEDEDDAFSISKTNMALDDDFFEGLEEFTGECLVDNAIPLAC